CSRPKGRLRIAERRYPHPVRDVCVSCVLLLKSSGCVCHHAIFFASSFGAVFLSSVSSNSRRRNCDALRLGDHSVDILGYRRRSETTEKGTASRCASSRSIRAATPYQTDTRRRLHSWAS